MKVVLLHAFPLDERMWDPQLELLADEDVYVPNFYDLGGNSLLAARLTAALRDRVPVPVAVLDLYRHQSVQDLAAVLDRRLVEKGSAS